MGIWSGKVVVENVGLTPNLVKMMEMPINIEFSSIGMLSLQVPWKSLASSPVEVLLQNVFLIITPTREMQWDKEDFDGFEAKAERIRRDFITGTCFIMIPFKMY